MHSVCELTIASFLYNSERFLKRQRTISLLLLVFTFCLCVCMSVCVCLWTWYLCMCMCLCVYICACLYAVCTNMHVHVCRSMCVLVHVCVHACMERDACLIKCMLLSYSYHQNLCLQLPSLWRSCTQQSNLNDSNYITNGSDDINLLLSAFTESDNTGVFKHIFSFSSTLKVLSFFRCP